LNLPPDADLGINHHPSKDLRAVADALIAAANSKDSN